ncbi:uncharacterized protein C7orf73 homolog [Carlito syrichta]|uniref:Uncharacterized protein C7orf73 homolog n=1 Tax=Carlito syrichta TaxID=1868482 RepID=A0A3Q0DV66_CARSF|nr:uncharacterized protein C7orf73 homolog [Carlito syrichta]
MYGEKQKYKMTPKAFQPPNHAASTAGPRWVARQTREALTTQASSLSPGWAQHRAELPARHCTSLPARSLKQAVQAAGGVRENAHALGAGHGSQKRNVQSLGSRRGPAPRGPGAFAAPPELGFTLGNVVGMYLAQNYDIPNLAKKIEEIKKDLDAKKKPPSS